MPSITRLEIEQNIILFALSGSHAYGLNTETSDNDYKGITIAPKRFWLGFERFDQKDKGWDQEPGLLLEHDQPGVDSVVYDIRRFLQLAAEQNPNILEMLWQKPDSYLSVGPTAERYLLGQKEKFLTKKMSKSFTGYARSQIKKMLTHRNWLRKDAPPLPKPEDFGIQQDQFPLSHDQVQRFLEFLHTLLRDRIAYFEEYMELSTLLKEIDWKQTLKQYPLPSDLQTTEMVQELTRANNDFMSLLHATQQYHKALKDYESYQNWKATRNAKRSAIEAKCGYDGKNASHCLRLLFMGYEGLTTGKLTVDRKEAGDADFLLAVKQGNVPYEEIDSLCDEWFNKVQEAYETTTLPAHVDHKFLNELSINIVESVASWR